MRALILGPGGITGAYGGGVAATLCRELPVDYFNTVYGVSSGAYTASHFVDRNPNALEFIWRELMHSGQLMRLARILKGTYPALDLFFLNDVLRDGEYKLNIEAILKSNLKFIIVATECKTGKPRYFSPDNEEIIFTQLRASAAVPIFHPPVKIHGEYFIDGSFSDPLPIEKAALDGHREIVVVCNKYPCASALRCVFESVFIAGFSSRWQIMRNIWKQNTPEYIENLRRKYNLKVSIISPSKKIPLKWAFDDSHDRINQTFDLGVMDANAFIDKIK